MNQTHDWDLLKRNSQKDGLSQSSYLRMLISGYRPKPLPPAEYHQLTQNSTTVHAALQNAGYRDEAADLRETLLKLQEFFAAPQAIDEGCGAWYNEAIKRTEGNRPCTTRKPKPSSPPPTA
ncbi:MAG: hypothetical protein PHS97_01350 [Oscillospiraceae bacterium]|nr:hypothetical protein [Oscillospiraceae bacterium]